MTQVTFQKTAEVKKDKILAPNCKKRKHKNKIPLQGQGQMWKMFGQNNFWHSQPTD